MKNVILGVGVAQQFFLFLVLHYFGLSICAFLRFFQLWGPLLRRILKPNLYLPRPHPNNTMDPSCPNIPPISWSCTPGTQSLYSPPHLILIFHGDQVEADSTCLGPERDARVPKIKFGFILIFCTSHILQNNHLEFVHCFPYLLFSPQTRCVFVFEFGIM